MAADGIPLGCPPDKYKEPEALWLFADSQPLGNKAGQYPVLQVDGISVSVTDSLGKLSLGHSVVRSAEVGLQQGKTVRADALR